MPSQLSSLKSFSDSIDSGAEDYADETSFSLQILKNLDDTCSVR
jgi:hypothetical protein